MVTLQQLINDLRYQIEYEALWREPTDDTLKLYINWAYADLAVYSLALVALRRWELKDSTAGITRYPSSGTRGWEWGFEQTGLFVPYHVLWEGTVGANTYRRSLQPSIQVRPEILLQNPDRLSRAPSSIDEHPASAPRIRVFPENRLGAEPLPASYPNEFYYHNGRFWFYPEPVGVSGSHGHVWIFGAFMPYNSPHAVYPYLDALSDVPALPLPLAQLIPEMAFYYWARGITDLYPLAEQKRANALQIALMFRQQMVQLGVQGAPFTENMLNPEVIEQLGGRLRNTPGRRGTRTRASAGAENS